MSLLAQDQWGTFADRQAKRAGASRTLIARRVDRGHWTRFAEGSLGFPDWPASYERSLWAALHCADELAVVGGRAAAALYGAIGFPRNTLELLVPFSARNRNPIALVR